MATYWWPNLSTTASTTIASPWQQWTTAGVWNAWTSLPNATGVYYVNAANAAAGTWSTWTTNRIWDTWNTTTAGTTATVPIQVRLYNGRTPEELAAAEEQWRVRRAADEVRLARERADVEQAVQRAETTLHENLTVRQRRSLRARNSFRVQTRSGRRYEIQRGHHANVYELDGHNKRAQRLCVYPLGGLPDADCMLAQKFWLEANEDGIRRTAVITPVYA